MLTVKMMHDNMERIVEATSVAKEIIEANAGIRKHAKVVTFKNGEAFESVVDGHVFVMNENGKTVAVYHLDKNIEE